MPEFDMFGSVKPNAWITEWKTAFDVEKVTEKFFKEYKRLFENAEKLITGINNANEKRLYTQKVFNRLLFIRFLEKKGWLIINNKKDYLRSLWNVYKDEKKTNSNFYKEKLQILFFSGLNSPNEVNIIGINKGGLIKKIIGDVPYLNGGLFEQDDSDRNDKIRIPDDAIYPVINELFYNFNFTVTESTPLEIDVAVDPEMLGKIFEELVTGRQESGSYYTPRSIVSFMCKEALKGYLGGYETLIDDRNINNVRISQAREILIKLSSVRIVDPACGSGAYLLGMLHELQDIFKLLDTHMEGLTARDDYERKLAIIQNNLYGIDIDPFATNIAKLRLWLSLIVEYDGDDPPPLPNLDFKIENGDSLTAPDPLAIPDLFRDLMVDKAKKIAELKGLFLRSHHGQQFKFAKEIELEEKNLEKAFKNYTLKPLAFDWLIKFVEVFAKGGFDIVIANPPYGLKCEDPLRFQYFNRLQNEESPNKDSYGLFMARALQLLKPNGYFTYIVSDTWRTIRSFKQLRKLLLNYTTILHIIDLPQWVFKATVNTCILSLRKEKESEKHTIVCGDLKNIKDGNWSLLEDNLKAVANHSIDLQTLSYARYSYSQLIISKNFNIPFFIASQNIFLKINKKTLYFLMT